MFVGQAENGQATIDETKQLRPDTVKTGENSKTKASHGNHKASSGGLPTLLQDIGLRLPLLDAEFPNLPECDPAGERSFNLPIGF